MDEYTKSNGTNSGDTSGNSNSNSNRDEGDLASTNHHSASNVHVNRGRSSWLLEQTIRYHEERINTNGFIRCELWLYNNDGKETSGTSTCSDKIPDLVSYWRRNTSNSGISNSNREDVVVRPRENKDNLSDSMLDEQLANHLWNHHKTSSDPNVLWHRVSSLNDVPEEPPIQVVPKRQRQRQHQRENPASFENPSKALVPSKTVIDWVASISFRVPSEAADTHDGEATIRTKYKGMICWLFQPTPTFENKTLIEEDSFQLSNMECFLRAATNHIAVTYALESSFKDLPFPQRKFQPHNSTSRASNPSETTRDTNVSTLSSQRLSKNGRTDFLSLEIQASFGDNTNDNDNDSEGVHDCKTKSLLAIQAYLLKFRGAGQMGPQPLCWRQTLFTFVGSFVTIYLIHWFNVFMTMQRDNTMAKVSVSELSNVDMTTTAGMEIIRSWCEDYSDDAQWEALEMGPFGATCVMVFAMTSVAPSQPRSLLIGVTTGMVVGKLIGYLELVGVGVGFRMPLATALTASIMARTCTIYPPAAALSLIFSSQLLGWDRFGLQLFGTLLIICLGVAINNLHPLRTYPSFWFGIEEGCWKKNQGSAGSKRRRASSTCQSIL